MLHIRDCDHAAIHGAETRERMRGGQTRFARQVYIRHRTVYKVGGVELVVARNAIERQWTRGRGSRSMSTTLGSLRPVRDSLVRAISPSIRSGRSPGGEEEDERLVQVRMPQSK